MTWLETTLAAVAATTTTFAVLGHYSRANLWAEAARKTGREWQLAMAYLAAGKAYPYEALFANAIIHGHETSLRRHFPDYAAFRAVELERMEEDDAD